MRASDYQHFIGKLCVMLESKIKGRVEIDTVVGGGIIIYIHSPGDFVHSYNLTNVSEMIQDDHGLDKVTNAALEKYRQFVMSQYFY